ncbi:MAG: hypothetical protein ACI9LO_000739 [Planctomycetota bacterium]|jgi:hypothetical protein
MAYKCLLDYAAEAGTVYIKGIVFQQVLFESANDGKDILVSCCADGL